jgi:predicted lipoprotein with Yx(FWY)xxD motif
VSINTHLDLRPRWRSAGTGLALAAALAAASYGGIVGRVSHSSAAVTTAAVTAGAKVTIKTAKVAGLGTVLVDGAGRTLYTLTSEAASMITCTTANGCIAVWPQIESRSGHNHQTRGGARSSMLSSEKGDVGTNVLTYHGWPLYTYVGDTRDGSGKGEGLKSFGGTWYAVSAAGGLVRPGNHQTSSKATPTPSSSGYGY